MGGDTAADNDLLSSLTIRRITTRTSETTTRIGTTTPLLETGHWLRVVICKVVTVDAGGIGIFVLALGLAVVALVVLIGPSPI